jgi:hypothetical protein
MHSVIRRAEVAAGATVVHKANLDGTGMSTLVSSQNKSKTRSGTHEH